MSGRARQVPGMQLADEGTARAGAKSAWQEISRTVVVLKACGYPHNMVHDSGASYDDGPSEYMLGVLNRAALKNVERVIQSTDGMLVSEPEAGTPTNERPGDGAGDEDSTVSFHLWRSPVYASTEGTTTASYDLSPVTPASEHEMPDSDNEGTAAVTGRAARVASQVLEGDTTGGCSA